MLKAQKQLKFNHVAGMLNA